MTQTLSKAEYLKASRGLAAGFGPTVDFTDQSLGTTSQSEGGIGVAGEDLPGQVFSVDQLPDPEVARAYGLPPVTIPEHLILDSTREAEKHVQGKEPQDIATAKHRRQLKDPVLAFDNVVRPADDAMTSFSDRTGENAFGNGDEDVDNGRPVDPVGVQKAQGADEPVKTGDEGVGVETPENTDNAHGGVDPVSTQKTPGARKR